MVQVITIQQHFKNGSMNIIATTSTDGSKLLGVIQNDQRKNQRFYNVQFG